MHKYVSSSSSNYQAHPPLHESQHPYKNNKFFGKSTHNITKKPAFTNRFTLFDHKQTNIRAHPLIKKIKHLQSLFQKSDFFHIFVGTTIIACEL